MIGIVISEASIHFIKVVDEDQFETFEKPAKDEIGEPITNLSKVYDEASAKLNFTNKEDFRLLVDFPLCHCVTQSVPFPENQLGDVLENYLEEELPHDIEDYSFEYKVLASKKQSTAILGFWIDKEILSLWTKLADEYSLNSLDIQPAEMAFIPNFEEEPHLTLQKDLYGHIRYSSFILKGELPHLLLGKMAGDSTIEDVVDHLKFQGPNWKDIPNLILGPSLDSLGPVKEKLGITNCYLNDVATQEPISAYATNIHTVAEKNLFNYRKGEFAQRGIEERILFPVCLAIIAIIAYIVTQTMSNYKELENNELVIKKIDKEKEQIWKKLYPSETYPKKYLSQRLTGLIKQYRGDGESSSEDNKASSLQLLGKLFQFINSDDEILITRVGIGQRSVKLVGTTKDPTRFARFENSFKTEDAKKIFKAHQATIKPNPRDKEIWDFTFNTSRVRENKRKSN